MKIIFSKGTSIMIIPEDYHIEKIEVKERSSDNMMIQINTSE